MNNVIREQLTVQSQLTDLQDLIAACDDEGKRKVLISKRDALLGHLAAIEDFAEAICDI